MSKRDTISEKNVREYLQKNLDFFLDKPDILANLEIPHSKKGSVSLVERQIDILRKENKDLKDKLNEFIHNASLNHNLIHKIYEFAYKLIHSKNFEDTINISCKNLIEEFDVMECTFLFFNDIKLKNKDILFYENSHDSLKPFKSFIDNNLPRCNKLKSEQLKLLFKQPNNVKSCALIPLGIQKKLGFLAISSDDENRFNPDMSMDYLKVIGQLISQSLKFYQLKSI